MGKRQGSEGMKYQKISVDDLYTRLDDWKFKRFSDMDDKIRCMTIGWIDKNLKKRKTVNKHRTVYGVKHVLQAQTGIYLTESQFAEALLMCGFQLIRKSRFKYVIHINVSEKSSAFIREREQSV